MYFYFGKVKPFCWTLLHYLAYWSDLFLVNTKKLKIFQIFKFPFCQMQIRKIKLQFKNGSELYMCLYFIDNFSTTVNEIAFLATEGPTWYRKDTEHLYHAFVYSLIILLSSIYPFTQCFHCLLQLYVIRIFNMLHLVTSVINYLPRCSYHLLYHHDNFEITDFPHFY